MMRYRRLGRTGLVVSEVGLGGGGIGHVWGATTEDEVAETIGLALREGINFFDVAPSYGMGRAEENLGRALTAATEYRDRVLVATKVSLADDDLEDMAGAAERSLTRSLELLRRDSVDLFQLHNSIAGERGRFRRSLTPRDALGADGALAALERLREQGLTRFIGITGLGEAAAVREVVREGEIDTVQVYYNLLNPSAARPLPAGSTLHDHGQLLGLAAELGIGVIGIRSHAGGALSGPIDREVAPDSLAAHDAQRSRRLDFLTADAPLAQVATRYVLEQPAVASVIPGVKNRAELQDAIAAMELPALSEEQRARLERELAEDFGVAQPTDVLL